MILIVVLMHPIATRYLQIACRAIEKAADAGDIGPIVVIVHWIGLALANHDFGDRVRLFRKPKRSKLILSLRD